MSEREDEVSSDVKLNDDFVTLVADDIAIVLEKGMSTMNFYVDQHTSKFTGRGDEIEATGIVRELRIAIKLPTAVLQGLGKGIPMMSKELIKPDIDRVWVHVDRYGGRPRKFKQKPTTEASFPDLD